MAMTTLQQALENYKRRTDGATLMPKAVLFDMDGVLYNSMPYHAKSWVACMADCGLVMREEDAYRYEGMRGVETIRLMARKQWGKDLTEEEAAEIYRDKTAKYTSFPIADKIPGVYQLQQFIRECGWTVGVVTGSGQPSLIARILDDFKGLVSPSVIVTANDVRHGKPQPDPYLKGMEKAGTQPNETIVVENAPLGVRSAVAAKCFTIAVNTGPLPDEDLACEGADAVVGNMVEAQLLLQTYISKV